MITLYWFVNFLTPSKKISNSVKNSFAYRNKSNLTGTGQQNSFCLSLVVKGQLYWKLKISSESIFGQSSTSNNIFYYQEVENRITKVIYNVCKQTPFYHHPLSSRNPKLVSPFHSSGCDIYGRLLVATLTA